MQDRAEKLSGRLPVKVAILSHYYPLHHSYNRIFAETHPEDYCVLNCVPYADFINTSLPGRHYQLGGYYSNIQNPAHIKTSVWLDDLRRHCRHVYRWAKFTATIARNENCGAIISTTAGLPLPLVGLIASKLSNLPVCFMMFDPWSHMYTPGLPNIEAFSPLFTKFMEPLAVKYSNAISSLNEFIAEYVYKKYDLSTPIVRIPYQSEALADGPKYIPRTENRVFRILFSGGVYYSHHDAFKNYFDAVKLLNTDRIMLDIYAQPGAVATLKKLGGSGLFKYHGYVPPEILYQKQKQTDALFLPLAFNSPVPEVVRLASPTKMAEYLATGRPTLVHAPPDAYINWYFKKNECGLVVDELNPPKMASALTQLLTDDDQNYKLGQRSLEMALRDFSPQSSFDSLCEFIQSGLINFANKRNHSSSKQQYFDYVRSLFKSRLRPSRILNRLNSTKR